MAGGSGNPDYDRYAHEQFLRRTQHGPGSFNRAFRPGLQDLTEGERSTLRKVTTYYDRFGGRGGHSDIYTTNTHFTDTDRGHLESLEGLGFIRKEKNGRLVPGFIFQEHRGRMNEKQKRMAEVKPRESRFGRIFRRGRVSA